MKKNALMVYFVAIVIGTLVSDLKFIRFSAGQSMTLTLAIKRRPWLAQRRSFFYPASKR